MQVVSPINGLSGLQFAQMYSWVAFYKLQTALIVTIPFRILYHLPCLVLNVLFIVQAAAQEEVVVVMH